MKQTEIKNNIRRINSSQKTFETVSRLLDELELAIKILKPTGVYAVILDSACEYCIIHMNKASKRLKKEHIKLANINIEKK